jgi:hypothetical protein
VICDGQGTPLTATLTAGNRHDITELILLVDRVPPTGAHGKFSPNALVGDADRPLYRQTLSHASFPKGALLEAFPAIAHLGYISRLHPN